MTCTLGKECLAVHGSVSLPSAGTAALHAVHGLDLPLISIPPLCTGTTNASSSVGGNRWQPAHRRKLT